MIRSVNEVFEEVGTRYEIGGNTPFLLNDPESVWLIKSGTIEIFSVRVIENNASGTRYHFFTAKTGDVLFGMDLDKYGEGLGLLAVGVVGTQVIKFPIEMFRQMASAPELADEIAPLVEQWIMGLSYAITKHVYPKPRVEEMLEAPGEIVLQDGKKARSKKGLVWLGYLKGSSLFIGMEEVTGDERDVIFPIASDTWVQAIGETHCSVHSTKEVLNRESMWSGTEYFYEILFKCEFFNTTLTAVDEYNRLTEKANRHNVAIGDSLGDLASILGSAPQIQVKTDLDDALFSACLAVGQVQGIQFQAPRKTKREQEREKDLLNEITKASRVRFRNIVLRADWWVRDNGPMIGFWKEANQPVAILPISTSSYVLYDPVKKMRFPVTEEISSQLSSTAVTFYRPFPGRVISGLDVLRFCFFGTRRDIFRVLIMAAAVGLLGLVVPIATGYIFDTIIPQANKGLLLQISIVLFVIAAATFVFQISQSIAMLRVEGKFDPVGNAAVMDRLLALPVPFFRNFSAGDLAMRANGLAEIRKLVSGPVLLSLFIGLFSLFNFALLFYFEWRLALIALAVTLVAVIFLAASGYFQIKYQRELRDIEGKITGIVFQIITGISKLRVAGAEGYAFAYWAKRFAEQRRVAIRARLVSNRFTVFNSILPIAASLAIFWCVAFGSDQIAITTGDFLAFNSAFTQFLGAIIGMGASLIFILNLLPLFERLKPILHTLPEADIGKASPGELSGEIEVNHLSFRYEAEGPLILKEVSFHVVPGEFIAFVGPSGSGKSTLFRLLLGFETPERGTIQYDRQDLSVLDIDAVRRQVGVVLQQSRIMPGNILQNITGSSLLTIDDAWEAARMAGLEQDIKEMPMGMHTVISEGASTFSGGQLQRLLIARAIANRPRVLLFDEATSALDNRTQAIVSESLERLQATRIVIAHRLSTIINADRIFVMQDGRIVQTGSYKELMNQQGLFAELAKRQLI